MKILSLFDGISCGRVALERAGIKVDNYYASEIDKYAMQVSQKNYPDIIQLGDINNYDSWELPEIDMIIGGSPCQDLSNAKQGGLGLAGSRSGLFYKFVECLKKFKPKYFLLENVVPRRKEDLNEITRIMGVEPILINSALVSAQQRKRYYWTNIHGVTQPDDKGIILQNILESGIIDKEKSYCLKHQAGNTRDYFKKHHTQIAFEPLGAALRTYPRTPNGQKRNKRPEIRSDDKANCLTSVQTDSMVCEPIRIGTIDSGAENQSFDSQQYRVYSPEAKSITLCGNGGGMGAKTGLYAVPIGTGKEKSRTITKGYYSKGQRDFICDITTGGQLGCTGVIENATSYSSKNIYCVSDNKITINDKQYPTNLPNNNYIIRKLTPIECERLQTLPDNYTAGISNTQRYKAIGNGWTVDVIAHIFRCLNYGKS